MKKKMWIVSLKRLNNGAGIALYIMDLDLKSRESRQLMVLSRENMIY